MNISAANQQIAAIAAELEAMLPITPDEPPPPPLTADAGPDLTATEGQPVTLAVTVAGGVPPYKVTWDFGDGTFGSGASVVHTYAAGTYSPRATVEDSTLSVAWDSVNVTVKVAPPPVGQIVNVGPSGEFAEPHLVPWANLPAGCVVNVVGRANPYLSKIVLNRGGLTIKGVPGTGGVMPVIDARNAVENADAQSFSTQITANGAITIVKAGGSALVDGITIDGLKILGCRRTAQFTDKNGAVRNYSASCAGVAIYTAANIKVTNCEITDNENGIFSKSDASWGITRALSIIGNYIHRNGMSGNTHVHNVYTESDGIIYEFNRFERLVSGGPGCLLKDRSAGAVIGYNRFDGPNDRFLDLVDPEEGAVPLKASPLWGKTFVYSNLILNVNDASVIHFGFDGMAVNTQRELYFYFNTCRNTGDNWKFNWFKTHGSPSKVFAGNNIFWDNSTDQPRFYVQEGSGTYFHVLGNWVSQDTWISADSNGNQLSPGLDGWNQQNFGTNPGLNADLTLTPTSPCRGKTVWPTGWPISLPTHGWSGTAWIPRTSHANIGASE